MAMKTWLAAICLALCMVLPGAAWAQEGNPLSDAQVGEWVLYRMQSGMEQKQTVTAVTPDSVTVKVDMMLHGRVVNSAENTLPLRQPGTSGLPPEAPEVTRGKTTLEIKNQPVSCDTFQTTMRGQTSKTYICPQVPVMGMVRSEANGRVVMELLDYGR
jgi:hypothetical protein